MQFFVSFLLVDSANKSLVQAISDGLSDAGFAPEIRDLSYFQDDYGLKPIDGEDDENEDNEEEEDEEDEEGSDGIGGSEGYEIIEGNEDDLEE